MSITPEQCIAARGLLRWTQDDLTEQSGVAKKTIADFEREASKPYARTVETIRTALEAAGVVFIDDGATSADGGPGVRMKNDDG